MIFVCLVDAVQQYTATGEKIFKESSLISVMKNQFGRKALLHFLNPFKGSAKEAGALENNMIAHLEPDEYPYFQVRCLPTISSKKAPAQRVKEHLVYLQNSALTSVFDDREIVLSSMWDVNASKVLLGLITTFMPPAVCEHVISLAEENPDGLLEDFNAHKVLQGCLHLQQRVKEDPSLASYWSAVESSESDSSSYPYFDFCGRLSAYLCANDSVLRQWLSVNRLSYIVVELLKTQAKVAGDVPVTKTKGTPKKRASSLETGVCASELGRAVSAALDSAPAGKSTPAKGKATPKKAKAAATLCTNQVLLDLFK